MTWRCSSQTALRELELYRRDLSCDKRVRSPEGQYACRVIYRKDGGSEVLWLAKNDADYCEPKAQALIVKLQQAGFECEVTDVSDRCEDVPQIPVSETPVSRDEDAKPVEAEEASPVATDKEEAGSDLRGVLQEHYEGNYLEAMIAAIPAGFEAQPGTNTVSDSSGEHLLVGPPDHFIKTMSDKSYVLVNTLLLERVLERETTSSFLNLGFRVRDKRYRFLGYAMAASVADSQVLDADADKVVLSITSVATDSCASVRRMTTVPWTSDLVGEERDDEGGGIGQASIGGCEKPITESSTP